ncbi:MAG: peroxiredoxin [Ignavibacteriae bacterium 37-53-5]|nr:MAG: peroxiredoxin [Ignavibacteriae bacterium 37-53-5]
MAVEIGKKAPDFKLYDTDRKERSLSEFTGKKVVLAFYPGAFTGVCTKEMCNFRDSLGKFNNVDAQVIGISVDPPFSNKAFADQNKLTFPVLSDFNRQAVKAYDSYHENFLGLNGYTAAKRAVFVVDRAGVVQYKWVSENPGVEPNYDEVLKAVAAIK